MSDYWYSPDAGVTWSSAETLEGVATGLRVGIGGPLTVSDLRRGVAHPIWFWRWDLLVHRWVGFRKALAFAYIPTPRAGSYLWVTFREDNASWSGGEGCATWGWNDGLPKRHPVQKFLVGKGWRV